jgi:hypothetical protein
VKKTEEFFDHGVERAAEVLPWADKKPGNGSSGRVEARALDGHREFRMGRWAVLNLTYQQSAWWA